MRALEELLNEVRDRESRRYLEDAIRAYNVGDTLTKDPNRRGRRSRR